MSLKRHIAAWLLFAGLLLLADEEPARTTAKDAAFELLNAVEKTGLLHEISPNQASEFQGILLKLLDVPASLEGELTLPKRPRLQMAHGNRIAIMAIPQFDDDLSLELGQLAELVEREKPAAILLDLCGSCGDSPEAPRKLLDYLGTETSLVAVLFDAQTRGMAESMLPELLARGCLSFGEASAGLPGARQSIPLSNGTLLKYHAQKAPPVTPTISLAQTQDHHKWPQVAADHLMFVSIAK